MAFIAFSIRSGSSGNSIYIGSENEGILVDAGVSAKCVTSSLESMGINPSAVKAILVSHEHSDHISGVKVLAKKLDVPVISTEATLDLLSASRKLPDQCQTISVVPNNSFYFNNFEILPISLPHDAIDPVGFRIFKDGLSCSVITDLGHFPKGIFQNIRGSQMIFIESNHDMDMLNKNDSYPMYLKKRILGKKGHLSNSISADAIKALCATGTRHFLLSHLSLHNNTYDLAYRTSYSTLIDANAEPDIDFSLDIARHDIASKVYLIK